MNSLQLILIESSPSSLVLPEAKFKGGLPPGNVMP